MRDIAEKLGVSVMTVSKALSDKDGVGKELKERIRAEAEKIGYRKNTMASDMRLGSSHNIGLLFGGQDDTTPHVHPALLNGLIQCLTEMGYYAIEEIIGKEKIDGGVLPNIVKENKVEGVIILGFLNPSYVALIDNVGIPMLYVDFFAPSHEADAIICDNVYGFYLLTRHLLQLGHTDIVFIGNPLFDDNTMDRCLGYEKALKEQGLPVRPAVNDMDSLGKRLPFVLPEEMPTAFICASSETAFLLEKLLSDNGYAVPKNISVVCFDDDVYAKMASPPITAFHIDYHEMAFLASVTIIQEVNESSHVGRKTISGKIVYRQSTAKAVKLSLEEQSGMIG